MMQDVDAVATLLRGWTIKIKPLDGNASHEQLTVLPLLDLFRLFSFSVVIRSLLAFV
jgi:hypothetical protein